MKKKRFWLPNEVAFFIPNCNLQLNRITLILFWLALIDIKGPVGVVQIKIAVTFNLITNDNLYFPSDCAFEVTGDC